DVLLRDLAGEEGVDRIEKVSAKVEPQMATNRDVPMVMLTATISILERKEFYKDELNIYEILEKPVRLEKICKIIDKILLDKEIKSILYIDDSKDCLDSTLGLLELKYPQLKIYTARQGEAAFDILFQNRIDLIFTDYSMPGMNGIQLAEKVRNKKINNNVVEQEKRLPLTEVKISPEEKSFQQVKPSKGFFKNLWNSFFGEDSN
ncbi:MAG: response regulator, partial [Candidatus Margulisbacteria bacterium]|nr:response regulator [Candidatus Margulisiibacteriota bacterium]